MSEDPALSLAIKLHSPPCLPKLYPFQTKAIHMSCARETLRNYVRPNMLIYHFLKDMERKLRADQAATNRHLRLLNSLRHHLLHHTKSNVDIDATEIQFREYIAAYSAALAKFNATISTLDPEQIVQMLVASGLCEEVSRKWVQEMARWITECYARYERCHGVAKIEKWYTTMLLRMKKVLGRKREMELKMKTAEWKAGGKNAARRVVGKPLLVVLGDDEEEEDEDEDESDELEEGEIEEEDETDEFEESEFEEEVN